MVHGKVEGVGMNDNQKGATRAYSIEEVAKAKLRMDEFDKWADNRDRRGSYELRGPAGIVHGGGEVQRRDDPESVREYLSEGDDGEQSDYR